MPKSAKSNQQGKSSANRAKIHPVSRRVRAKMISQIRTLNAPPFNFPYEKISASMGHQSGYAHLLINGGRVTPTAIAARGLAARGYTKRTDKGGRGSVATYALTEKGKAAGW